MKGVRTLCENDAFEWHNMCKKCSTFSYYYRKCNEIYKDCKFHFNNMKVRKNALFRSV